MTRPADLTRQALIAAATDVFAEAGFTGGPVRLITEKAGANQAAVNYHFGGKEGLYHAVLKPRLPPSTSMRSSMRTRRRRCPAKRRCGCSCAKTRVANAWNTLQAPS